MTSWSSVRGDGVPRHGIGQGGEPRPGAGVAGERRVERLPPRLERPGLGLGRAGLVGQVVGVPQEGVQRTHRPPAVAGQQQEGVVEVLRLATRQRGAETITLPERPVAARLHGATSDRGGRW